MGSARDITQYSFSDTDALLFDTNVWLDIYGPQSDPAKGRVRAYSGALKDIELVGSKVNVDVLVMCEFVNRYARLEYHRLPTARRPRDFKAFRDSPDFAPIARAIVAACRKIDGHCTRTGTGFATLDLAAVLTDFEGGAADLNDLLLADLCTAREWTFVTHDADFAATDLDILTANQGLLAKVSASAASTTA